MKSLEELKRERKTVAELVATYEKLMTLTALSPEQKKDYAEAKKQLDGLNQTIDNLEANVPYTKEEMDVFALPEDAQEDAWFELLKNCDFSKDAILRICSMLRSDGLLPIFKSSGICISEYTAHQAYKLLGEHGIECLSETTRKMLFKVKTKIKNGEVLSGDELIYQLFLEEYDDAEDGYISGRCAMQAYNHFTSVLHEKFDKTGDYNDRADYFLDRVAMALSHKGVLASGEKEFIAIYFRDKEKE